MISIQAGFLWILSGVPGSGKTSVAAALAKRYPRAAHLPMDAVDRMLAHFSATPVRV